MLSLTPAPRVLCGNDRLAQPLPLPPNLPPPALLSGGRGFLFQHSVCFSLSASLLRVCPWTHAVRVDPWWSGGSNPSSEEAQDPGLGSWEERKKVALLAHFGFWFRIHAFVILYYHFNSRCNRHWSSVSQWRALTLLVRIIYLFLAALGLNLWCAGLVVVERGLSCPSACGILGPQPGIKCVSLHWKVDLNHWTTRYIPNLFIY